MDKTYQVIRQEIEFQKKTATALLDSIGQSATTLSEEIEVVYMYREAMAKVDVLSNVASDLGMTII